MKNYKVIIWGLGSVGRSALQIILLRKTLNLVGVFDVDPNKVGKDAGEIFGFEKAGVIVSNDADSILALDADIVLYYAPHFLDMTKPISPSSYAKNVDDIVRFLDAGKNVATTLPVYFSKKTVPEYYERINEAALRNNVTYVQQGIFPGLYTPYMPVIFAMNMRKIDSLIVYGGELDSHNEAPWAKIFGYGKNPDDINQQEMDFITNLMFSYYGPTTIEVAERAGIEYDEYSLEHETVLSDAEDDTINGHILPGTVGAHVFKMCVKKEGKEVCGFHFIHKGSENILPELLDDTYIEINGQVNMTINLTGILTVEDPFLSSAAPSVNLIPAVVDAPAGYKGALDIPVGYLPQ